MTDPDNAYDRLMLLARRCDAAGIPGGRWLSAAIARSIETGCTLDEALGLQRSGWASPRLRLLQARRAELLHRLYQVAYRGVSLRSAASVIASDHARIRRRLGDMRPGLGGSDPDPRTPPAIHMRYIAEGFDMPSPDHLRAILARTLLRPAPLGDLRSVEIIQPIVAASPDVRSDRSVAR